MKKVNIFLPIFQGSSMPFSRDTLKNGYYIGGNEYYSPDTGFEFGLLSRFVNGQGAKYNQAW